MRDQTGTRSAPGLSRGPARPAGMQLARLNAVASQRVQRGVVGGRLACRSPVEPQRAPCSVGSSMGNRIAQALRHATNTNLRGGRVEGSGGPLGSIGGVPGGELAATASGYAGGGHAAVSGRRKRKMWRRRWSEPRGRTTAHFTHAHSILHTRYAPHTLVRRQQVRRSLCLRGETLVLVSPPG